MKTKKKFARWPKGLELQGKPYQGSCAVRIYALIDPRDQTVRYVGATRRSLAERLTAHVYRPNGHNWQLAAWIGSLKRDGLKPVVRLLARKHESKWEKLEKHWSRWFRSRGALYNIADGGPSPRQAKELRPDPTLRKVIDHLGHVRVVPKPEPRVKAKAKKRRRRKHKARSARPPKKFRVEGLGLTPSAY